jgi:hypothetical protein
MNTVNTLMLANGTQVKCRDANQPLMLKLWNLFDKTYCSVFLNSITGECIGKPFIVTGMDVCFGDIDMVIIHPHIVRQSINTENIFGKNFNDYLIFGLKEKHVQKI